jgi:hypothetical protein
MLVLFTGLAITVLAFAGSYFLLRLFGKTSGLDQLAELYPASSPPQGQLHNKQWVAVGKVSFNNADVCATPEGLYLWVRPLLSRYRPALIPWAELRDPQPAMLHLQRAVRLSVGSPQLTTLTCTQRLFETMQPYLD